ncbi:hypothetical protein IWQ60_003821 [Tieghemiomyces parasiticus]|uniref:Uncharacterized protein n=1 Tax=Tieghemiomyces parasiticus TaxID=78921 RepID=A0A9W8AA33_9FUNG|nr:hypothetical protein IWQ60_003821 [Tieghemiomyces parasiticus]
MSQPTSRHTDRPKGRAGSGSLSSDDDFKPGGASIRKSRNKLFNHEDRCGFPTERGATLLRSTSDLTSSGRPSRSTRHLARSEETDLEIAIRLSIAEAEKSPSLDPSEATDPTCREGLPAATHFVIAIPRTHPTPAVYRPPHDPVANTVTATHELPQPPHPNRSAAMPTRRKPAVPVSDEETTAVSQATSTSPPRPTRSTRRSAQVPISYAVPGLDAASDSDSDDFESIPIRGAKRGAKAATTNKSSTQAKAVGAASRATTAAASPPTTSRRNQRSEPKTVIIDLNEAGEDDVEVEQSDSTESVATETTEHTRATMTGQTDDSTMTSPRSARRAAANRVSSFKEDSASEIDDLSDFSDGGSGFDDDDDNLKDVRAKPEAKRARTKAVASPKKAAVKRTPAKRTVTSPEPVNPSTTATPPRKKLGVTRGPGLATSELLKNTGRLSQTDG